MTARAGHRPSPRRAPRVAAGLACLGVAVGLAAWIGGAFDRDPVPGDARPAREQDAADAVAAELAATPRVVVPDGTWVRLRGRVTTPEGGPAAGARVRVVAFPSGAEVWRGTADEAGRFACEGEQGTLYQAFVAPAAAPGDETLFPAEAVAGRGAFEARLRSAPRPGLFEAPAVPARGDVSQCVGGQVVDEDGVGVAGVVVAVVVGPPEDDPDARSRADGVMRFGRRVRGASASPDGRFLATDVGVAGEPVTVVARLDVVNGTASVGVPSTVGTTDLRVVVPVGPATTVRCPGAGVRVVWLGARRPAAMTSEAFDELAPRPHRDAAGLRLAGRGELRFHGGDERLPFVVYLPPTATDDHVAWFDGLVRGGEATLSLRPGRTVSGRVVGLPPTTGGRPEGSVTARPSGVERLEVNGTFRGDRYEVRGLPEGTRWDVVVVVVDRSTGTRRELRGTAGAVVAGADADVTLAPP